MRSISAVSLGLLALLLASFVAVAAAAGGQTIAAGPTVVSGQQYFGNTANIPVQRDDCHKEFWRLQLLSGDVATINFGVTDPETNLRMRVYELGTDDFNVDKARYEEQRLQSNGKAQLVYKAVRTGVYPLRFSSCAFFTASRKPGPFDFVAYVKHGVRLFMPARAGVSRTSSVVVTVRTPDGSPITDKGLKVTLRGNWGGRKPKTLGQTTASNGLATFKLGLPVAAKGQTLRIRAIAQGENYLGALSATRAMRIR